MPTIKTKKRMNKKEYAQFLIDNAEIIEITASYRGEEKYEQNIKLEPNNNKTIPISKDILEIEIEEEITEDTVLPELVTRTVKGHYGLWKKGSINSFKHITFNDVEAFYVPNDDLTMTLIWTREKGLIE
ncbi:hypothetical protein [Mammaliicoccus sciuri]|uniref:hypothetical protein n=1 Tax=Mammaliicoccus sciuri TaxID=1296 RepID=UPI00066C9512|nr:hypothetical protein [Mammaliicoccus sciuri]